MRKLRFFFTFLGTFALLLVAWRVIDGSRWYTAGLLAVAGVLGPILHGWVLQYSVGRAVPTWVYGGSSVEASIQFDALAVGVVPLLALLAATPGLSLRSRALRMLVGTGVCFGIDALIVALFPPLVFYKNAFTDVIGTFLGLIGFVGAPVIIWFVLTLPELRRWLPSLGLHALSSARSRPA